MLSINVLFVTIVHSLLHFFSPAWHFELYLFKFSRDYLCHPNFFRSLEGVFSLSFLFLFWLHVDVLVFFSWLFFGTPVQLRPYFIGSKAESSWRLCQAHGSLKGTAVAYQSSVKLLRFSFTLRCFRALNRRTLPIYSATLQLLRVRETKLDSCVPATSACSKLPRINCFLIQN